VDGELTHAVRKSARFAGDPEGITPVPIADDEAALALRVLAAAPGPFMYARVDLARDEGGRPCLMELELIEPSCCVARPAAVLVADRLAVRGCSPGLFPARPQGCALGNAERRA